MTTASAIEARAEWPKGGLRKERTRAPMSVILDRKRKVTTGLPTPFERQLAKKKADAPPSGNGFAGM